MKSLNLIFFLFFVISYTSISQENIDTIWTRQYFDIYDAVITPDGEKVIVAVDGSIHILDASNGEHIHTFEDTKTSNNEVFVSPDSKYLYSHDFIKWDLDSYEEIRRTVLEHPFYPSHMDLTSDGSKIYCSSNLEGTIENWAIIEISTSDMKEIKTTGYKVNLTGLELSNNDELLAVTSGIGTESTPLKYFIEVLNTETYEAMEELYNGDFEVDDMKFTNDSENLSYTTNGSLFIYNFSLNSNELILEKEISPNINYRTLQFYNNYMFINTLGLIQGKLFETDNFNELAVIPISMAEVHDFQSNKVLFGNKYYLYFYDLKNIINGISSIEIKNLRLLNDRIQFVSHETLTLLVFDYLGNEYMSVPIQPGNINIDLTNLEGGCYFITLNNGQSIQTIKFIRG